MHYARLPRFKRTTQVAPMQLTPRDHTIIHHVSRHRFLLSSQIVALLGESSQQILRRLQLLYHHGFLERPRAQIDYYHRGGSREMVYGLGNKGANLLKQEFAHALREVPLGPQYPSVCRLLLVHGLIASAVI